MKTEKTSVEILDFSIRETTISITGISPLIVHAWSEKSKKMIEDKQQQKAKNKKHELRVPEEDYEGAKYKSPLGFEGVPAAAFKSAMIRGAKMCGMVMTETRSAFFIKADCEETQLVRINGESRMRTDMVRVGNGSSDIRYRPEYPQWYAELTIEFNAGAISLDQIYQIIKAAGYGVGIGELRPEKGAFGFGRFKLANEK